MITLILSWLPLLVLGGNIKSAAVVGASTLPLFVNLFLKNNITDYIFAMIIIIGLLFSGILILSGLAIPISIATILMPALTFMLMPKKTISSKQIYLPFYFFFLICRILYNI